MSSADITKRALADAMKTLMSRKPLTKISVGDITKECGITRNSFYYHFKDKFDLVNWIFHTEIIQVLNDDPAMRESPWNLIEGICTFFDRDKNFYQNALTVTGQNSFIEYLNEYFQEWVQARVADIYAEDEDQDFFVAFFSQVLVGTLSRWLTEGATIPPDKFAKLIRKAVTGG